MKNFLLNLILGNPGLQRGRDRKGETGSGKKVGGGEGKGKRKGEAVKVQYDGTSPVFEK